MSASDDFVTKVAKLQSEVDEMEATIRTKDVTNYVQYTVVACTTFIIAFLLFSISPSFVQTKYEKKISSNSKRISYKFSLVKFLFWTVIFSAAVNSTIYFVHKKGIVNFE